MTLKELEIITGTVLEMKSITPPKQYTHSILSDDKSSLLLVITNDKCFLSIANLYMGCYSIF